MILIIFKTPSSYCSQDFMIKLMISNHSIKAKKPKKVFLLGSKESTSNLRIATKNNTQFDLSEISKSNFS